MSESLRFEVFTSEGSPAAAALPGDGELDALAGEALVARGALLERRCAGADFLGWLDLPLAAEDWIEDVLSLSLDLVAEVDHLVVAGIGGSYLGARAVLKALSAPGPRGGRVVLDQAGWEPVGPEIHFAGHDLSGAALDDLLRRLHGNTFAVNVISKSGTTLETAAAFRVLREELVKRHGTEADDYIIATTDPDRGALRAMARARGWRSFPIPPDVGGRFSVLSPVGLVPLAAAGLDVTALLDGARSMRERFLAEPESPVAAAAQLLADPVLHYAALRQHLRRSGKAVEVLACFEPALAALGDWWAQLFGESEGKGGQGLFPARVAYTTDLHSLGQYLQDGPRHLFETFLHVEHPAPGPILAAGGGERDGLDNLAGMNLAEINRAAERGTMTAHDAGGVPVLRVSVARADESGLGELIWFFEAACAVSALMQGVNPFDQPGVEAYKAEMRRLLER
ncbi:MAG: glucose-6-phosphate isomerase [Candidatus Krumholzibacteriota bacterium]|nr:glucose-6-phosphate isomerase [Candidatus Krumholzibacteriota bacterium]